MVWRRLKNDFTANLTVHSNRLTLEFHWTGGSACVGGGCTNNLTGHVVRVGVALCRPSPDAVGGTPRRCCTVGEK